MPCIGWAEAPIKIARMTLTIKLDGNWSSFQLANNTPPLSVTGSVIAPSARIIPMHPFIGHMSRAGVRCYFLRVSSHQHANTVALPHITSTHLILNGPLSRIAPQRSFHQRQEMSWPFVSWAMKPHHHGPELGKLCLRASSVITIEVILCKYSRRSHMRSLLATYRGRLYRLMFTALPHWHEWASQQGFLSTPQLHSTYRTSANYASQPDSW